MSVLSRTRLDEPSHLASIRFGLGPRPGERPISPAALVAALPTKPRRAKSALGVTIERLGAEAATRAAMREARKAGDEPRAATLRKERRDANRITYHDDLDTWLEGMVASDDALQARLTLFFADHFTVSAGKASVRPLVGPMIEEAIRPRVLGRFGDLLEAAVLHPAMLLYLDQERSVGPSSRVGKRRKRGLNENLAREILELHTLGVAGGYDQRDVVGFARLLTGVKIDPKGPRAIRHRRNVAEPGSHTVLGRSYVAADGMKAVRAALRNLALEPSTGRFVTGKLARHFVGPNVAPALLDELALVYGRTNGSIPAVMKSLLQSEEAWALPLSNVRTPVEYVVAAARLGGPAMERGKARLGKRLRRGAGLMGQRLWHAPSPAGWPREIDFWLSAAGLAARLDWAGGVAPRLARSLSPEASLDLALGPVASDQTRRVIERAPNAPTALSLLLGSPEFNMR